MVSSVVSDKDNIGHDAPVFCPKSQVGNRCKNHLTVFVGHLSDKEGVVSDKKGPYRTRVRQRDARLHELSVVGIDNVKMFRVVLHSVRNMECEDRRRALEAKQDAARQRGNRSLNCIVRF